MSQDYETKRSDLRASKPEAGSERPAAEDPLVELARIVHRNKQSGANVSSGRVGSTDYFAGLDDVAEEPPVPSRPAPARVEPTFSSLKAVRDDVGAASRVAPVAPEVSVSAPVRPAAQAPYEAPASHVSSLWPSAPSVESGSGADEDYAKAASADHVLPFRTPHAGTAPADPVTDNEGSYLARDVSLDLEQNLTAELEDELIGVLRQSVDETQPVSAQPSFDEPEPQHTEPEQDQPADREQPVVEAHGEEPPLSGQSQSYFRGFSDYRSASATPSVTKPQFRDPPAPSTVTANADDYLTRAGADFTSEREIPAEVPSDDESLFADEAPYSQPVAAPRPRIDENDFLAALNPVAAEPAPKAPVPAQAAQHGQSGNPAGIDALFADLDFPDPVDRRAHSTPVRSPVSEAHVAEDEIDDMTWPAAAASVPRSGEDETPPPPEGYDLDAVARAMQESDPSLTGAGVLPPHSAAERSAVPHAREKSRRGLYVAAGVLGVAVIGGAAFFFADGDAVPVPSGPPPVIAGLEQPLKIYPEQGQTATDDQQSKLIYDRVDGNGVAGPERLVGTESPKPAELPPAPAGTSGGADLVPGATKRVRTVLVRPDGSIISNDEDPGTAAPTPVSPASTQQAEPEIPAETPRAVTTTPVVPGAASDAPAPAETPTAAPAQVPAIVTGADVAPETAATEPVAGQPSASDPEVSEPEASEPATPPVTVTPRKKPDAPVQVASAPPAATAPAAAPANQDSGPLNLSQQATAPTPAAPAATAPAPSTSGEIASGTYVVQVTSQRSEAAASEAYAGLQRRFPAILGNRDAVIVAANVDDRGVFYRARIPTTTRDDAISLCESLQAAGGDCFVRRQP